MVITASSRTARPCSGAKPGSSAGQIAAGCVWAFGRPGSTIYCGCRSPAVPAVFILLAVATATEESTSLSVRESGHTLSQQVWIPDVHGDTMAPIASLATLAELSSWTPAPPTSAWPWAASAPVAGSSPGWPSSPCWRARDRRLARHHRDRLPRPPMGPLHRRQRAHRPHLCPHRRTDRPAVGPRRRGPHHLPVTRPRPRHPAEPDAASPAPVLGPCTAGCGPGRVLIDTTVTRASTKRAPCSSSAAGWPPSPQQPSCSAARPPRPGDTPPLRGTAPCRLSGDEADGGTAVAGATLVSDPECAADHQPHPEHAAPSERPLRMSPTCPRRGLTSLAGAACLLLALTGCSNGGNGYGTASASTSAAPPRPVLCPARCAS